MFCFFYKDAFVSFWGNQIGDIFAELTCKSMKWEKSKTDLIFYTGFDKVPEYFEFDATKKLIIKFKKVDVIYTPVLDANGQQMIDPEGKPLFNEEEIVTWKIEKQIAPTMFFVKGIMVKPC